MDSGPDFSPPTISNVKSKIKNDILQIVRAYCQVMFKHPHLSNELNDSLLVSPMPPRKDGGRRLWSTTTSSDGVLTRLRRISFTFFPLESAGREGLTSEDNVDKASEIASGPWVTPVEGRSPSLAAAEVWSSLMPESYRWRETPFSISTVPETVLLSEETQIRIYI